MTIFATSYEDHITPNNFFLFKASIDHRLPKNLFAEWTALPFILYVMIFSSTMLKNINERVKFLWDYYEGIYALADDWLTIFVNKMSDGVKNELSAFPDYNEFADCAQWKGETIIELHKTNTTELCLHLWQFHFSKPWPYKSQNFVFYLLTLAVHTYRLYGPQLFFLILVYVRGLFQCTSRHFIHSDRKETRYLYENLWHSKFINENRNWRNGRLRELDFQNL